MIDSVCVSLDSDIIHIVLGFDANILRYSKGFGDWFEVIIAHADAELN